ncbi:hypothetical protein LOTGIDRAFT_155652 [Lottia gigantea]|uniref:Uncharacterized protein n=1 Tax=Lottia gigantea TaxID=225164 RepID=V3YX47_LOTGI|nr:hypothetical protein LOTGIDRAFT_155652 [Lottia gigantea]ESO82638.1 hypothetical protein LOTGIDRAFT_155652 [Lottia gigantea]
MAIYYITCRYIYSGELRVSRLMVYHVFIIYKYLQLIYIVGNNDDVIIFYSGELRVEINKIHCFCYLQIFIIFIVGNNDDVIIFYSGELRVEINKIQCFCYLQIFIVGNNDDVIIFYSGELRVEINKIHCFCYLQIFIVGNNDDVIIFYSGELRVEINKIQCFCYLQIYIVGNNDDVIIFYSGELRVEINKIPWSMKIYDNNTDELIITEEGFRSQKLGYGKWVGDYIDIYQGYLFRIGVLEYQYYATNVSSVTYGQDDVTVTIGTDDPRNTSIIARIYTVLPRQLSFSFQVDPPMDSNRLNWGFKIKDDSEGFYGFGERFNSVNQRGEKLACWTEDGSFGWGKFDPYIRFPGGKTSTYVPMPLFISSRRYGFQLDTFFRSEFDSKTKKNVMHIVTESSSFNATLFAGRTIRETVKIMTDKNGRSLIPPKWAFGPWNQLDTEISGESEVDRAKKMLFVEDIPLSVVIDTVHFFPAGQDKSKFPLELANNQQLLYMGLPSTAYYNPLVTTTFNGTYNYGDKMKYFTLNKHGQSYQYDYIAAKLFHVSQVDFTNYNATQWYSHYFHSALNVQYKGWMYDYGEYTPYDSINSRGQTGLRSHNEYPLLYQKACFDFLTQNQTQETNYAPDYLFYVRSGYLGSQKYTWAHWTGDPSSDWTDASGLPAQIVAMLSIGISGMPFSGSDIGGFEWYTGPSADEELWVRWSQLGCFSGYMHEQGGGKGISRKTHIFGTKNGTKIWRKFAKLRTQLFPYIYTQAHIGHYEGLPIMRHHLLDFDDEEALKYQHQFMFGEDLLVAPIYKPGVTTWNVYLPKGRDWIDISSKLTYDEDEGRFRISQNTIIPGGRLLNVAAPLDTTPLFIQAGSILPLLDPSVQTLHTSNHPNVTSMEKSTVLHLWVWPDINNEAYGNDWQNNSYKIQNASSFNDIKHVNISNRYVYLHLMNELLMVTLTLGMKRLELESMVISNNYNEIVYQIVINPPDTLVMVQYKNGTALEAVSSWQDIAKSKSVNTYFFEKSKSILWLAIPNGAFSLYIYL